MNALKTYLTYSATIHIALAVAALRLLTTVSIEPSQVYTIDFVGPSTVIAASNSEGVSPNVASSPAEHGKPPPQSELDEFARRQQKSFVLPRPSLLRGFQAPEKDEPTSAEGSPAPTAAAAPASSGGGGGPNAGIETDMPNFPYPWYITQVRSALWNQWSAKMPKQSGQSVIVFSILPNGSIVDLRIEESSGEAAFDLTALGSVQDATPFASLPRGFDEPFLKIHVTLRSQ